MNYTGCDEDSQHIDRAGLAEKSKNTGWKNCVGGKSLQCSTKER
jgi:hypothetical protein